MITTLDALPLPTRDAARSWLDASVVGVDADLRQSVRDELRTALLEGLEPDAAPSDLAALIERLGPIRAEGDTDAAGSPWVGSWHGLPYDLRPPTADRVRAAWWNPADARLLTPRVWGAGWAVNFGAVAVRLGLIEPDAEDEPFTSTPDAAFAAALAVPVACAAAVVAHYAVRGPHLPDPLPNHWDFRGTPDAWTPRRRAALADSLLATGSAGLALAAVATGRPRPERAAALASATFAGTLATWLTVQRSLQRPRWWVAPASMAGCLGATGAVLLGLARAGRRAEQARDLSGPHDRAGAR